MAHKSKVKLFSPKQRWWQERAFVLFRLKGMKKTIDEMEVRTDILSIQECSELRCARLFINDTIKNFSSNNEGSYEAWLKSQKSSS